MWACRQWLVNHVECSHSRRTFPMRLLRFFSFYVCIYICNIYLRPVVFRIPAQFLPLDAFPIMFYFRISSPYAYEIVLRVQWIWCGALVQNRNLFVHSLRILTNKYLLTATMDWIWIYLYEFWGDFLLFGPYLILMLVLS